MTSDQATAAAACPRPTPISAAKVHRRPRLTGSSPTFTSLVTVFPSNTRLAFRSAAPGLAPLRGYLVVPPTLGPDTRMVVVLHGTDDTVRDPNLRTTPLAEEQGADRYHRAGHMYRAGHAADPGCAWNSST